MVRSARISALTNMMASPTSVGPPSENPRPKRITMPPNATRTPARRRRLRRSPGIMKWRSEEHTSELQSHSDLVCRLLLEKKNHVYSLFGDYVDSAGQVVVHNVDVNMSPQQPGAH